jgi:uncharacterized membrane protein
MSHVLLIYNIVKIIHVISASVLFGTGMGTAAYMLIAHYQPNLALRAKAYSQVVYADWLYTTPSAVIQAFSGLLMIYLKGYFLHLSDYQLHAWWVQGSILAYVIAGLCWLPVLYLQTKMKIMTYVASTQASSLPEKYFIYFKLWIFLGIIAFSCLCYVFYLMANRPLGFF